MCCFRSWSSRASVDVVLMSEDACSSGGREAERAAGNTLQDGNGEDKGDNDEGECDSDIGGVARSKESLGRG